LPISHNFTRVTKPLLDNPAITAQPRGLNEIVIRRTPVRNATGYEVRIGTIPGLWQPGGLFDANSEVVIKGLVPGLDYYLAVRALGTDGVSAWSDPVVYKTP